MPKSPSSQQELMIQMIYQLEDFALLLLDTDGNILSWNKGAEKLTGHAESEILGENASILVNDLKAEFEKHPFSIDKSKENKLFNQPGWCIRKDNSLFWAGIQLTALTNKQTDLTGFSLVLRDLTYLKNKESENKDLIAKLHLKNKELEEFNYMVSHDLQEPLRTIRSFIGILDTKYTDHVDEKVLKITQTITKASERMNVMLIALLEHSRIGRTAVKDLVNLKELCKNVLLDLGSLISTSEAQINCKSEMPTVLADKLGMQVLFQNLISNAIKFAQETIKPKVEISFIEKETHFVFAVKDNGIGIPESQQERIFVIFQRLHLKEEYDGTGIGLAHCKKIIEMHNGKIWVESKENVGSTFYFTLPKTVI